VVGGRWSSRERNAITAFKLADRLDTATDRDDHNSQMVFKPVAFQCNP
jgi:hypothetical protein